MKTKKQSKEKKLSDYSQERIEHLPNGLTDKEKIKYLESIRASIF